MVYNKIRSRDVYKGMGVAKSSVHNKGLVVDSKLERHFVALELLAWK